MRIPAWATPAITLVVYYYWTPRDWLGGQVAILRSTYIISSQVCFALVLCSGGCVISNAPEIVNTLAKKNLTFGKQPRSSLIVWLEQLQVAPYWQKFTLGRGRMLFTLRLLLLLLLGGGGGVGGCLFGGFGVLFCFFKDLQHY